MEISDRVCALGLPDDTGRVPGGFAGHPSVALTVASGGPLRGDGTHSRNGRVVRGRNVHVADRMTGQNATTCRGVRRPLPGSYSRLTRAPTSGNAPARTVPVSPNDSRTR